MCALSRRYSPAPAFAASHAHTISPRSRESAYGRGVMPSHLNAWQQRRAVARSVKCSRTASANCAGVHPQPMDGTQSTGRHQAGRRRERRTRPPPGHRERPASTRMDERCAGVARRCGARRFASRHGRHHPIGCPQRTGKGGHEPGGEGRRRPGLPWRGTVVSGRARAEGAAGAAGAGQVGVVGDEGEGEEGNRCTRRPREGGSSGEGRGPAAPETGIGDHFHRNAHTVPRERGRR